MLLSMVVTIYMVFFNIKFLNYETIRRDMKHELFGQISYMRILLSSLAGVKRRLRIVCD